MVETNGDSLGEVVEVELSRGTTGLGFNIRGGVDSPYLHEDNGIFVVKIREDGAAFKDGRLKEGDKVLEINGFNLINVTHVEAVNKFLQAGENVHLKVIPGAARKIMERADNQTALPSSASSASGLKLFLGLIVLASLGVGTFFVVKHLRTSKS